MEAQAQWAGKLLQEYQKRAEASGFPGPHAEVPQPTKDSPAKTVQGLCVEVMEMIQITTMKQSQYCFFMTRKTQILICKNISERQYHSLTMEQTCSTVSHICSPKYFLSHVHTLDSQSSPKSSPSDAEQASNKNSAQGPAGSSLKRLRSSCVVVRMDDVDIHQASLITD